MDFSKTLTAVLFALAAALPLSAFESADRILEGRMKTPLLTGKGAFTGEGPCWYAAFGMGAFVDGYKATKDVSYLDAGVKYYDALISKMYPAPDGYKGWVGPYMYDGKFLADVHVGDGILINQMLDFSETVLKSGDEKLRQKYGEKANSYVDLAKKHLIEKYDKRGTWIDNGAYGNYVSWDRYMTAENTKEWKKMPEVQNSALTLPFNKNMVMGIAALRIYRITGQDFYREKALKIFNMFKSRLSLFEDHYVWSYWEPYGSWDIASLEKNDLRHWVNVHPFRNYQEGEVQYITEAYHSGITFTKEDMQRIVNTNIKMYRGGKEWVNSNNAVRAAAKIKMTQAVSESKEKAGTLWGALTEFDQTLAKAAGKTASNTGFKRSYAGLPVTDFVFPFNSNKYLTMVCLLPAEIESGREIIIVSKSIVPGDIEISLYSADGSKKIIEIFKGKTSGGPDGKEGLLLIKWNAKDTATGKYRVRWTLNEEYRDALLTVR